MDEIVGVVLAGGRGRRFGGQDKGWQQYQGKPLVEHALQHLEGCSHLLISANRHLEDYQALGVDVVVDKRADYQGPLSGIESVMQVLDKEALLYVLPCDVLGAPAGWRQSLYQQLQNTRSPWVGTVAGGRLQPLLGLWSCQLLHPLGQFLDAGERRVMDFIQPYRQHALALPSMVGLKNINSPEDLA